MREASKEVTLANAMLAFAEAVAKTAACDRAQYGCVMTTPDMHQIVGYGYNGPAAGLQNACKRPEEPGNCGCVHAEVNACIKSPPGYKIAFITGHPCGPCASAMVNSGVLGVVYSGPAHREYEGLEILNAAGIPHGTPEEMFVE